MRISSSQIFDAGTLSIQRSQGDLYRLQNQLSTGRRILAPADDPVAAAQALVVSQSKGVTEQHMANQDNAGSQLRLVDVQLSSLTDLMQNVRERTVQAGNTVLTDSDRQSIATDLEARLGEMMGIANSDNGTGDFMFSGYKGTTRPFAIDPSQPVQPPATVAPVNYFGDDGERLLQVSASRQIGVNVAGSDVFMKGRSGNGTFVAATGGSVDTLGVPVLDGAGKPLINQGSATIDAGTVLDPQKWSIAVNSAAAGQPLEIRFSANAVTGKMEYGIYDPVSAATTGPFAYTPGQTIQLKTSAGVDFGSQVAIDGQPVAGDTFKITPSTNQSVFQTMQNLIGILRSPVGTTGYTSTQLSNDLSGQLTNIDQAMNNVSRVQATVGTRLRELDSLKSTSKDMGIQFSATLSTLQDVDYVKAISDFTKQQVSLEAAQKSFTQITGLSLFKLI